jgi:hypothetical protein
VDASSIALETPLNPFLYYYIFVYSRAATILGWPALYYYPLLSSPAPTILWGRMASCGRLSIGQMSLTSSTPRLRLAAMRGRLFKLRPIVNRPGQLRTTASRRVANPPQDAILPHFHIAHPIERIAVYGARATLSTDRRCPLQECDDADGDSRPATEFSGIAGPYSGEHFRRIKRIEDNLDGLIRAITAEHGNGKPPH